LCPRYPLADMLDRTPSLRAPLPPQPRPRRRRPPRPQRCGCRPPQPGPAGQELVRSAITAERADVDEAHRPSAAFDRRDLYQVFRIVAIEYGAYPLELRMAGNELPRHSLRHAYDRRCPFHDTGLQTGIRTAMHTCRIAFVDVADPRVAQVDHVRHSPLARQSRSDEVCGVGRTGGHHSVEARPRETTPQSHRPGLPVSLLVGNEERLHGAYQATRGGCESCRARRACGSSSPAEHLPAEPNGAVGLERPRPMHGHRVRKFIQERLRRVIAVTGSFTVRTSTSGARARPVLGELQRSLDTRTTAWGNS
jgi:hypothetical protein